MKRYALALIGLLVGVLGVPAPDALIPTTAAGGDPVVRMATSLGNIDIELDPASAPATVKNFMKYVEDGFYDGLIFHRVIPGFMVQGGGMEPGMRQRDTRDPIENEADNGLKNDIGTIAMARTSDPHSASAQFFINVADNEFLNHTAKTPKGWGYAVFGRVVAGMDVVNAIAAVETGRVGPYADVPREDIVINSASVVSQ